MSFITILLVFAAVTYFLYSRRPNSFNGQKVDYSFGDVELQKIKTKLEEQEYTSAEFLIQQLEADDLRQVIDYVTLNGSEKMLLDWQEASPDSQLAQLFLGVHYSHQTVLQQGVDYAQAITNPNAKKAENPAEQAATILEKINGDETIMAETYARLVRVMGTLGEYKEAEKYFEKCMELNPNHLWAHMEFAENLQPKWGGNLNEIEKYIEDLTDEPLINQTIYLKVVWDSVLAQQNLFGGTMDDLKKQAKALLFEIDAEVNNHPPTSIQRFVLYNYMTVVAEEFGIGAINKKYNKMMDGNFTLYPFGIMQ